MPKSPTLNHVQVITPPERWILHRMGEELAARLDYVRHVDLSSYSDSEELQIDYWINYRGIGLLPPKHGRKALVGALFTHPENELFLAAARKVDFCVCICRQYADWLAAEGIPKVRYIPHGADLDLFVPRLRLGIIGKTSYANKGRPLIEAVRRLPYVDLMITEGRAAPAELPRIINHCDYILITSSVEGGPMALLEALACGKRVIAPPDLGEVPQYTEGIIHYRNSDADDLLRVIGRLYDERLRLRAQVQHQTWQAFAENHDAFFRALINDGPSGAEPVERA